MCEGDAVHVTEAVVPCKVFCAMRSGSEPRFFRRASACAVRPGLSRSLRHPVATLRRAGSVAP